MVDSSKRYKFFLAGADMGYGLFDVELAKRVSAQLSMYEEVTFDCSDVTSIGRAFIGELFSVWPQKNSKLTIKILQAAPEVDLAIHEELSKISRHLKGRVIIVN